MDDVELLVNRVRAGDTLAFETLYDRFSRLVFGIALRMLDDADAAEDIVQGVFMKIWTSPEYFRGGNFPAWISRVARNQSLDHLRRRKHTDGGEIPLNLPSHEQLEDLVFAKIEGQRVRDALEEIPPEQRLPIELGFFGGITHEEIARRISTPLGTVKTRIRTGLQRLRRALGDEVAI